MGSGSLLVHGGILIDDLTFADGRQMKGVLGGAALHALAGAALWDDDVLLIGGVGQDADQGILPWMQAAGLSTAALVISGPFTPRNNFVYHGDGSRTETPVYGPEHLARLLPGSRELIARLPDARGAYVFHDADPAFWLPVLDASQKLGTTILWEISAESCTPRAIGDITSITRKIAGLSLNLQEAIDIFGDKPREALIEDVRQLGAGAAFLRCGAEGSIAIWSDSAAVVAAYPTSVVDVTGAGNAYGGGALAGLAQGAPPVTAAQMGSCAARFAVSQHGLFAPRDATIRASAQSALTEPVH